MISNILTVIMFIYFIVSAIIYAVPTYRFWKRSYAEMLEYLYSKNMVEEIKIIEDCVYGISSPALPYDKSFHYQHDDYLHHLNIRCAIFDVEQNCKITKKIKEFIRKTDKIFIKKTVEVPYVWINRNSTENPEDPQVYWFYYRVPPERIPNWYSEGSTEMKIYREWLGCYNENS